MRLIECVPNFSEGRDPAVIEQIVAAIRDVEGVHLLDVSSDHDHNRTVVTFAAPPDIITETAFRGIAKAAELIDLNRQRGQHPRIGAADVVPFIPLGDSTMPECVELARELAQRVADVLNLPVYLYEEAALRPEYKNLADVRRGGYEALKTAIRQRQPDYGPLSLGSAGAVAIGARWPLIAFNAYLDTDNVEIAAQIARTVRESGGGLPYLKALGLLVEGQAQVSMNVIDYRQTGLFTILERVRQEAQKHGTRITHTELVGLAPRAALIESALAYLQLPPDAGHLILEDRLNEQIHE